MGSTANTVFGFFSNGGKTKIGGGQSMKDVLASNDPDAKKIADAQKSVLSGIGYGSPLEAPVLPNPPSAFDAANAGAQAMTDAARRYRRQRGGGFSGTTINGAAGDPSTAPTFRKQLLGR